jgi:hypothetical protein
MLETPRLDTDHFCEREWDTYDDLLAWFVWEVPERFNMAAYCCDRWAEETPDAVAVRYEEAVGDDGTLTYATLDERARQFAGFLRERDISAGDRVGVNCPQRPETVLAHLTCWKLGATSVPLSTLFDPDGLGYRLDDADAVPCVVDGDPVDGEVAFDTALERGDPDVETVDTRAGDEAILLYTSVTGWRGTSTPDGSSTSMNSRRRRWERSGDRASGSAKGWSSAPGQRSSRSQCSASNFSAWSGFCATCQRTFGASRYASTSFSSSRSGPASTERTVPSASPSS